MKIPLNKLVLLNLDATLIDRDYKFTSPLHQLRGVVESLENMDWKIGLSSDTPLRVLIDWENEIGLNGPVVAEKGQLLMVNGKTIVKDKNIPIEFGKMFKKAQTLLDAEGIKVWSDGDPVARIRNGELIGERGETVVMLNPLRRYSLGLFVRTNDGTHFRFPDLGEYNRVLEVIKPVLEWQAISTHNDLNAEDGVIIIAPEGRSKRDGTKLLMQELGLKQICMVGNSMSDYLGEDIALHYAVGNASNEFKDKAICVAENGTTGGVIEILTKFLRTEQMAESVQNWILERLSKRFSLHDFEPLVTRGHTTARLYLCSRGKQQMVAKIGMDKEGMNEVSSNANGYAMISRAGGEALVPDGLAVLNGKRFNALVMPYLGKSLTQSARDNPAVLDIFFDNLQSLAEKTLVKDTDEHYAGIAEIKSQIAKWYRVLERN